MRNETKVGLFTLAGALLLAAAIFMLGDFSSFGQYPVYARFKDVEGLPDKAVVKLSGVNVGKVKEIAITADGILVRMEIHDGVVIYKDSVFKIGSTSMVGSKYVQINQGTPGAGALSPQSTVNGISGKAMDEMITQTLDQVNRLLSDIRRNGQLGAELNGSISNMRELTANINDLVVALHRPMTDSLKNVDEMTSRLQALTAKADELMTKINGGQGTVGALLTDREMEKNIKETVENVKETSKRANDILHRVGGFKAYWELNYRQDPHANTAHADFGMRVQGDTNHYYYVGLSNAGNSENISRGPDYEKYNSIDLQLGWYLPKLDFYAGLIHGGGGVGARITPFEGTPIWGRLQVFGEGSDFGRNRTVRGRMFTKPRYDAGLNVKINDYVKVGIRSADIAETGDTQFAFNLAFRDRDVSYLLGLVSLATVRSTSGSSSD
ncbi:MAG: MlaD family protein [Elusimicrobiaceae bacterium]|nr:MlaD family protein [Elusimicrobiaceae bacterium]